MRTIEYLSPTSISEFDKSLEEFYLRYLSDERPPRFLQTQPMSIGSAFDAYVKSYLHQSIFGKGHDVGYEFEALFEKQVEAHNRDWARDAGKYAFECYKISGALADIMFLLKNASTAPRFEFEIRGTITDPVTKVLGDMVLLGKPDLHFKNHQDTDIVLDWKVNGYCSSANTSPKPGYVKLRDGWIGDQSRTNGNPHKDAFPMMHKGVQINVNQKLEKTDLSWANQLCIYGWLLGMEVGSDFIVAIDQLACSGGPVEPKIRIAAHRTTISSVHQNLLYDKATKIWDLTHSDHIFRHLSKEDSKAKCGALDLVKAGLEGDGTDEAKWIALVCREQRPY